MGILSWLWLIVLAAVCFAETVAISLKSGDFSQRDVIVLVKAHWPWLLVGVVLAVVLNMVVTIVFM